MQVDAVEGERRRVVVGLAGPADPRTAAGPQAAAAAPARVHRGSAPTRRPSCARHREAVGGDDDRAGRHRAALDRLVVGRPGSRSCRSCGRHACGRRCRDPWSSRGRAPARGRRRGRRPTRCRPRGARGWPAPRAASRRPRRASSAPGCSIRLSTAPSDSASVNSSVAGGDALGGVGAAAQREADHPAEVAHLLGGRGVARDGRGAAGTAPARRPGGRRAGRRRRGRSRSAGPSARRASSRRAARGSSRTAPGTAPAAFCVKRSRSASSSSSTRDEPADDVAVTAEVLRRRVHDDVGAERERLLQVRRGERVVDDDERAVRRGRRRRPPRCRRT